MADVVTRQEPAAPSSDVTVSAEQFRSFMSGLYSGVTVVTAAAPDGTLHGLTCSSMVSVTLSPPTLMVSLHNRSGTLAAITATSEFVVNLLHSGGRRSAELFSSPTDRRFERVPWRCSPALELPHLVEDSHAFAECRVFDTVPVGDHTLVLGHVVGTGAEETAPLIYGHRRYVVETAPPPHG